MEAQAQTMNICSTQHDIGTILVETDKNQHGFQRSELEMHAVEALMLLTGQYQSGHSRQESDALVDTTIEPEENQQKSQLETDAVEGMLLLSRQSQPIYSSMEIEAAHTLVELKRKFGGAAPEITVKPTRKFYKINRRSKNFVKSMRPAVKVVQAYRPASAKSESYIQYKEKKMAEMAKKNGGNLVTHNSNMKRKVRGSNAPNTTDSKQMDVYRQNRLKNNLSAQKSRDKKRRLEVERDIKLQYFRLDNNKREIQLRKARDKLNEKRLELDVLVANMKIALK